MASSSNDYKDKVANKVATTMKTLYTKRGYAIYKKYYSSKTLNGTKKDLMMTPFTLNDFNSKPPAFPIFLESPQKLYLPKHYGFEKFGTPDNIKIDRGEPIELKFNGSLKEYQHDAINKFLDSCILNDNFDPKELLTKSNGGIISVGCGWGKTCGALYIISKLLRKAIVIVHKEFLMNQWKERIKQFLPDARVGTIQGKTVDIDNKDIVLCMLQSLSQKEYDIDLFDSFGTVIVDECFPYEQNIITDKGTIPIGDLYTLWKDEETLPLIKSYNLEKECFEWKKMTYAWEKENDKLIAIECNNTIYKSTYNHKYLTNYGWYPASDLKIGDLLKSTNKKSFIRIDNISYIDNDNKKVYDIEVEDNHNFIICGSKCENGVVVHNCHHISAEVFSRSLPKINSFYSLGLSATPNRTDGLSKVFYMYLGPMIYRLEKRVDKKIRVNVIRYIDRNEDYCKEEISVIGKACIPKMITNIVNHDARNHMIETLVYKLVHSNESEPRKILLLSDRRDHLENFYKRCSKFASVGFYVGGMKQKDLDISEKQQVILGTYPMSSEGLDIGDLNTVIFTTPKSSIEQSVGRIIRKQHAIEPLAFDIVDEFSVFPNQYKKRQQVYKKLEYDIYELRVKVNDYSPSSNPFEMILDMPYTKLETGRKKKKTKPDSDSDESDSENINNVSNRLMNECLIDE